MSQDFPPIVEKKFPLSIRLTRQITVSSEEELNRLLPSMNAARGVSSGGYVGCISSGEQSTLEEFSSTWTDSSGETHSQRCERVVVEEVFVCENGTYSKTLKEGPWHCDHGG